MADANKYKLSQRSQRNLAGVHGDMKRVVYRAIQLSTIDFSVIQGVRSGAQQRLMVASGASQTLDSKHLPQAPDMLGHAVDLAAYIGPRVSWELSLYDNIADAIKEAAKELDVSIRWGGSWQVNDITEWPGTMQEAQDEYIALRISQGRRPFVDAGHFELS